MSKRAEDSNVVPPSVLEAARRRSTGESAPHADDVEAKARAETVEAFYRDHWKVLCRRLRAIYGDGPPEPEDLAQAAFAVVLQLDDLARLTNPGGFLFRVAVNAGLDGKRRIARTRRLIEDELGALEKGRVEEITPASVYESREALSAARRAIDALPAKQREIVMRSRIKGETYAEIAAATGWSQADISRQLKAALTTLQRTVRLDDD